MSLSLAYLRDLTSEVYLRNKRCELSVTYKSVAHRTAAGHRLGSCWKHRLSGPSPDLLAQHLCCNRIPPGDSVYIRVGEALYSLMFVLLTSWKRAWSPNLVPVSVTLGFTLVFPLIRQVCLDMILLVYTLLYFCTTPPLLLDLSCSLFCYSGMGWLEGRTESVSGYTCCRLCRTLGQNMNTPHSTLPKPPRVTGFGLGMPRSESMLQSTVWDFSSCSFHENLCKAIL